MIDIRKLKELVRLMVTNDLTELDLRDTEEQVTMRRPSANAIPTVAVHPSAPAATTVPVVQAAPPPSIETTSVPNNGAAHIHSPMVGTFYDKPNPDAQPFITPGTEVNPETVVCLVEAMKIFNEIKAECTGTIEKCLVTSGEAVEFGQPLFEVKKG